VPRFRTASLKSNGSNNLKPCASPSIALPVPGGFRLRGGKETVTPVSPERDATHARHY
jgi:hypothetical protein